MIFFNTFKPVAPLFEELLPRLSKALDSRAQAVVLDTEYRDIDELQRLNDEYVIKLSIPKFLKNKKRLLGMFYFFRATLTLLGTPRKRPCIFLTQPPFFFILGSWICQLKKQKYFIHVMDMYPDTLVSSKILRNNGFVNRILSRLSDRAYQGASGCIVIGSCMKQRVKEKKVPDSLIEIIPNWALSNLKPVSTIDNTFLKTSHFKNSQIVMYSGNMGLAHNLSTILLVAKEFEDKKNNVAFVFIGNGVRKPEVSQAIEQGAKNIYLLPPQNSSILSEVLSAATLHFVSLREEFTGLMVPSKIYGILACGRATIFEGCESSEISRTIRSNECGEVVSQNDRLALSSKLQALLTNDQKRALMEDRARAAYQQYFDPNIQCKRYIKFVRELTFYDESR